MKIKPEGGGVVLTLDLTETDVLVNLFAEQSSELTELDAADARWRRLHPSAFADAEQAAEFRSMVEAELDALRKNTGLC